MNCIDRYNEYISYQAAGTTGNGARHWRKIYGSTHEKEISGKEKKILSEARGRMRRI